MADSSTRGHFVWHDLMTTDVDGAVTFYKQVVGWKTQAWEHDPSHLMWTTKRGPIGGLATLDDASSIVHPYWVPYVSVSDIEATINDVGRLGGKIVVPVTTLAHGGRYAIIGDPQGGTLGMYTSPAPTPPPPRPDLGDFMWHELATNDYPAAFRFYETLFGWQHTGDYDMGEMGKYFMFGLNGVAFGGMFNKRPDVPTHWVSYARVKDAKRAASAATKAGGKIIHGPMQVPGGSWVALMQDPQGAMTAVVTGAQPEKQQPHQPAEAEAAPMHKRAAATKAKQAPAAKRSSPKKKTVKKKAANKPTRKAAAKRTSKPVRKSAKKKLTRKPPAKSTRKSNKKKATKKK